MPKVEFVKARKDYPQFGIKAGAMHFVWSMKRQRGGVTKRSLFRPRPSQLTESAYKSAALELVERLEDLDATSVDDLQLARDEIVEAARALASEQQEKLDNMPEGLQQGPTGELLQERIDACKAFADELESVELDEFEPADLEEGEEASEEPENDEGQTESQHIEEKLSELQAISLDV